MHIYQKKILALVRNGSLKNISMRQIGRLIGIDHPQNVKHHLAQLEKRGLATYNLSNKTLEAVKGFKSTKNEGLLSIPVYGAVNCGPALCEANDYIEGYLKISPKLLKKTKGIFIIEASGDSMNKANINGKTIEDGDYVVIDSEYKAPINGDYIVSVIDGLANIKRFIKDDQNKQIVLMPESSKDYPPIFIGINELDKYIICGKVIQVIKKPKLKNQEEKNGRKW